MRRVVAAFLLATLCGLVALPAAAQTPVVNPKVVEFDPSADHAALTADNQPLVQRYQLQVFLLGAAQPVSTADLGKPAPDLDGKIRVDFSTVLAGWPLGDGSYQARVAAVGPTGSGTSDPSNTFAFQSQSCTVTLGSAGQAVPAGGASGSVTVTAGSGCAWNAASDAAWVTLGTTSGSGSGSVGFVVTGNPAASTRVATLTIGGLTFTLTQDAAPVLCSYALSAASQSFGQGGGTGSVTVTCGGGCAWSATNTAAWITLATGSGTGTAAAGYTVAKNTSTTARSATLTIAGVTYTVSQSAANRPSSPKKVRVVAVGS